jgi:hypothetical protein
MATQNPAGQACVYEDVLFEERVTEVISNHTDKTRPLMVFWATHIVHGPLQGTQRLFNCNSVVPMALLVRARAFFVFAVTHPQRLIVLRLVCCTRPLRSRTRTSTHKQGVCRNVSFS